MKKILLSLLVLSAIGSSASYSQDLKIPQPSTLQKIEQDFGLGTISNLTDYTKWCGEHHSR